MKKLSFLVFFLPTLAFARPRNPNPTTPNQVWQNDLDLDSAITTNLISSHTAIGSFTRALNGTGGSVSYTGLNFKPSGIIFLAGNGTSVSQGIDTVANHGVTASFGAAFTDSANFSIYITDGADVGQKAVVQTFDSNGFTLQWTKAGAPGAGNINIYYLAFK